MFRRTFCAALAALVVSVPALAADKISTLNFGIISTDTSANLDKAWQPVVDDMSKALGVQVKPFFASDYAGVIQGMRFNKVQVAWYGNESAIQAVDRSNGEVFARASDTFGQSGYWSVLLVNKSSKIMTLDQLLKEGPSLSYGAGDPNSTSGTAVPGYYLWGAHNINPFTFFKHTIVADHTQELLAVINKRLDAAISNTATLGQYQLNSGKNPYDQVRVLWKSPVIANDPLVYRKDLPADLKAKLQAFFVTYGKTGPDAAAQKKKLAALGVSGFAPSTDAQLVPIRIIDLSSSKHAVQADKSLSDDARKQKLAAIDAQIAQLQAQQAPQASAAQ